MQRMNTLNSALISIHMQSAIPQIDLSPSQGAEFSRSERMPISEKDRRCISNAIPAPFARSFHQAINLFLG
jgi:hypothetical protein